MRKLIATIVSICFSLQGFAQEPGREPASRRLEDMPLSAFVLSSKDLQKLTAEERGDYLKNLVFLFQIIETSQSQTLDKIDLLSKQPKEKVKRKTTSLEKAKMITSMFELVANAKNVDSVPIIMKADGTVDIERMKLIAELMEMADQNTSRQTQIEFVNITAKREFTSSLNRLKSKAKDLKKAIDLINNSQKHSEQIDALEKYNFAYSGFIKASQDLTTLADGDTVKAKALASIADKTAKDAGVDKVFPENASFQQPATQAVKDVLVSKGKSITQVLAERTGSNLGQPPRQTQTAQQLSPSSQQRAPVVQTTGTNDRPSTQPTSPAQNSAAATQSSPNNASDTATKAAKDAATSSEKEPLPLASEPPEEGGCLFGGWPSEWKDINGKKWCIRPGFSKTSICSGDLKFQCNSYGLKVNGKSIDSELCENDDKKLFKDITVRCSKKLWEVIQNKKLEIEGGDFGKIAIYLKSIAIGIENQSLQNQTFGQYCKPPVQHVQVKECEAIALLIKNLNELPGVKDAILAQKAQSTPSQNPSPQQQRNGNGTPGSTI